MCSSHQPVEGADSPPRSKKVCEHDPSLIVWDEDLVRYVCEIDGVPRCPDCTVILPYFDASIKKIPTYCGRCEEKREQAAIGMY